MPPTAPSPTYRVHWGLRESPFRGGLEPRLFFESPTHEEALARLEFLVAERRRLGLLIGEPGTGKSMLLEVLARLLRRRGAQVANVSLSGIDLQGFLGLIAAELGVNFGRGDDLFALWHGVVDRLAENRDQHLNTVLLLDDADRGSSAVFDQIARLVQTDRGPHARLTVVLARATGRLAAIEPRLLDLAELRIDVEPWHTADTLSYLDWSLDRAGRRSPVFSDAAMIRLHELSGGVPRRVNQLANLALVAGAVRQLPLVDVATVESIHNEQSVIDAAA